MFTKLAACRAETSLTGRLLVALAVALVQASCLPADTRPPPGTLVVSVTSDDSLSPARAPISTEDGWSIVYERFLLEIGNTRLGEDDESCNNYQGGFGSGYGRLLDIQTSGTHRLSQLQFLGACDFGFESNAPEQDDLLGKDVSEADRYSMRLPADDEYTKGRGTSLRAVGSARKGDRVKHFDWSFRQGLAFENCRLDKESGTERGVSLAGEQTKSIEIRLSGSVLFQATPEGQVLRFDAFADADDVHGNADGTVTLSEMALVSIEPVEMPGSDGADVPVMSTLADLVYLGLFPQIFGYRGDGTCDVKASLHADDRDGGGGPD